MLLDAARAQILAGLKSAASAARTEQMSDFRSERGASQSELLASTSAPAEARSALMARSARISRRSWRMGLASFSIIARS